MPQPPDLEIIRDPLWDNIRLDRAAVAALDTPTVQRLRYVRQLGHAFLVYPGATHTRFEHALGAYHLTRKALASLEERGELACIAEEDRLAVRLAALLHDIGHYPFSHALEEAGFPSHEKLGVAKLDRGELGERLREIGGAGFPARVGALITKQSPSPLQGLISGSLDLDKIDYLSRDAFMCGVPYGTVDVERLLASLTLVETGDRSEVGVHEKGVSALESLLFAKYQMYRNVYWHHAVRAATCMFKRAVLAAAAAGAIADATLEETTDDALMELLLRGAAAPAGTRGPAPADWRALAAAIRARRLPKRAMDLPASDVPAGAQAWLADDAVLTARVEDALAAELGLASRVFRLSDVAATRRGLDGVSVVANCAGPFSETFAPLADACLLARTHYVDITGEIDVFVAAERRSDAARAAGVVVCPGVGFDVIPTDCVAACLKQALPDATRLALGFKGLPVT
ncbi:MAG TPA: HD domain-containing protein, partial [Anaeromyxobacter sp.]